VFLIVSGQLLETSLVASLLLRENIMRIGIINMFAKLHRSKLLTLPLALALSLFGLATEATAEEDTGPFLVLIGAPKAGKTSSGKYISQNYGVPTINVMKVLQKEITKASEAKSPPGSKRPGSRRSNAWNERNKSMKAALKKLENGELVGDDVLNASVLARLLQDDCRNGFVLDGYPGSAEQAVYLDGLLASLGVDTLQVIVLDIPDEVSLERMAERGKARDKDGFAEARLALYRSSIGPILKYYQGDDLHIVDANTDRSELQAELDRILGQ
jgi:adenylate kinase